MPFRNIIADFEISSLNLADSVHLLDNLSITVYSIQADKYHVPHIVFF